MAKQKKPSIPPEIKSYIDEVAKKTAAAVSDAYKPVSYTHLTLPTTSIV